MTLSAGEKAQALETIRRGLDEDLRYGPDVTTVATVSADATTEAALVLRFDVQRIFDGQPARQLAALWRNKIEITS